jgi:hypothetical protein
MAEKAEMGMRLPLYAFSAFSALSASRDQKSNWALILAKRADRIDVGPSQAPFGMNAWL